MKSHADTRLFLNGALTDRPVDSGKAIPSKSVSFLTSLLMPSKPHPLPKPKRIKRAYNWAGSDEEILAALAKNVCMPTLDLADIVGISRSTARKRLMLLATEGRVMRHEINDKGIWCVAGTLPTVSPIRRNREGGFIHGEVKRVRENVLEILRANDSISIAEIGKIVGATRLSLYVTHISPLHKAGVIERTGGGSHNARWRLVCP